MSPGLRCPVDGLGAPISLGASALNVDRSPGADNHPLRTAMMGVVLGLSVPPSLAGRPTTPGARVTMCLPVHGPFAVGAMTSFLAAHAVRGLEVVSDASYARAVDLPHGEAFVELRFLPGGRIQAALEASSPEDLLDLVERCRQVLDLGVDPADVHQVLGRDEVLAPLLEAQPGLRLPGHVDPFELAVRAVIGQQVSVAGAHTVLARLVERHGEPLGHDLGSRLGTSRGGCTLRRFPRPERWAALDPDRLGMPRSRGRAVVRLASDVAGGHLDLSAAAEPELLRAGLLKVPGIGPWTAGYVAMRGLHDRDVFMAGDLVVKVALESLGLPASGPAALAYAERWRPWRSYAVMHLWRHGVALAAERRRSRRRTQRRGGERRPSLGGAGRRLGAG